MKGGIYLDPGVPHLVQRNFAVLNIKRGKRERFPENCVEVVGPSRSSEGLKLYYLVRWLNAE